MTLSNGLQVVLAERHELPSVRMSMIVNAGYRGGLAGASGNGEHDLVAAAGRDGQVQRVAIERGTGPAWAGGERTRFSGHLDGLSGWADEQVETGAGPAGGYRGTPWLRRR